MEVAPDQRSLLYQLQRSARRTATPYFASLTTQKIRTLTYISLQKLPTDSCVSLTLERRAIVANAIDLAITCKARWAKLGNARKLEQV
jgi:hypothetical protein